MVQQMHVGAINLVFLVSSVKNINSSNLKKFIMCTVSENNSELQQITYIKQTVPVIAQALQKSKQGKNIQ